MFLVTIKVEDGSRFAGHIANAVTAAFERIPDLAQALDVRIVVGTEPELHVKIDAQQSKKEIIVATLRSVAQQFHIPLNT